MPSQVITDAEIRRAHEALDKHGSQVKAARALGISRQALQQRLMRTAGPTLSAADSVGLELKAASKQIDDLTAQLATARRDLTALTGLTEEAKSVEPPSWLLSATKKSSPGTPVVLWSDWHWGEVVEPGQINGVNQYNMKIARERARRLVDTTIDLLKNHVAHPHYPGIVVCLGGDMLSGDIHDELKQTNDATTPATMLDLLGVLVWAIEQLADAFGYVHIPVVFGNHGRMTHKPTAKMAAHQNWDWLVGRLLQQHFATDRRITFQVSESADVLFKVHNTTILLTHGNQFYGGSGIAGMLSPLMLGDARKRKRANAIKQPYDLMIMGHWHQLFQGRGLIVNGSLKGYDEYAYQNNFDYEIARQALWIVHPTHGLNWWMPVNVQDMPGVDKSAPWCAVRHG